MTRKPSRDSPQPAWPYLLFSLGVTLIAVGAYQIQSAKHPGRCPFHVLFGSGSTATVSVKVVNVFLLYFFMYISFFTLVIHRMGIFTREG